MFGEKGTETFLKWIAGFIAIFFMLLGASLAHSAEIDEIQAAINQRNATWFAEDNPISSLTVNR